MYNNNNNVTGDLFRSFTWGSLGAVEAEKCGGTLPLKGALPVGQILNMTVTLTQVLEMFFFVFVFNYFYLLLKK